MQAPVHSGSSQRLLHSVFEANASESVPADALLLLVHAVMLDAGFVGAAQVCAQCLTV